MLSTWESTGEGLNPLSRDLGTPLPPQSGWLRPLFYGSYIWDMIRASLGWGGGIPIPTNAAPNNGFDERDKGRGQRVSGKKGSL